MWKARKVKLSIFGLKAAQDSWEWITFQNMLYHHHVTNKIVTVYLYQYTVLKMCLSKVAAILRDKNNNNSQWEIVLVFWSTETKKKKKPCK